MEEKKIFISWSGNDSHKIASALCKFLGKLKCGFVPLISSEIEAGLRWHEELHEALASSTSCVVCLTPQALRSRWLFYEAGALSLSPQCDHVCPYLIGLQQVPIDGPLNQFQSRLCSKEGTKSLIVALLQKSEQQSPRLRIASSTSPSRSSLPPELDRRFESHWRSLELVITNTSRKILAAGSGYELDRSSFDALLDMYLDAVAYRITSKFADSLQGLRDELSRKVVRSNITSMRHILQSKERGTTIEEIIAELRGNGLTLRLETLISDVSTVVWHSRQQLARFHYEAIPLRLTDFLDYHLPPAQLADCVLEALVTLRAAEWKHIYTYFTQKQNALKRTIDEMRSRGGLAAAYFDRQLDTKDGREFAKEFGTGSPRAGLHETRVKPYGIVSKRPRKSVPPKSRAGPKRSSSRRSPVARRQVGSMTDG